jgi:hypothetical protein
MSRRPNGRAWSAEDNDRLRVHIARSGSASRAAAMFKRSEAAVRVQAGVLGLRFPTIRELPGGPPAPALRVSQA